MPARNLKLTLAYDGTDFHGWQVQPGLPTIQGEIERVLGEIEGRRVWVHGSGRTDAGVHAHEQAASVTIENPIPAVNLRRAMNRLLPPSIRVLSVEEVPPEFHARFSARSKIYEYRLWRGEVCRPEMYRYVYHHAYPLATEPMARAAALLEGTHDFRAFASADDESRDENTERTILSSCLEVEGDSLRYRVEGSGFLHHMVRNIMGTLLEAGRGNLQSDDVAAILRSQDRQRAGPTAPARGLWLVRVHY